MRPSKNLSFEKEFISHSCCSSFNVPNFMALP
ncbi:hypothetical protein T4B_1850 [Trichinella pseudospiralis]|uniref:Uncharacterized protein n=1 Tax=Trichinella pseudospiralis TaxID=6337 RepID=A0A0V1G8U9_TRIPS|nr:hypothetical protein T4B_1850 [Trichinella pseudospiralis]KRY95620.1 hypothetical protein T4C_2882 [Trichinella pseudospiralis]